LSQAISQLGSSMTSFALILWAYAKNGKAMTVSLMSFSNYMPYIIVSLLAGTFVDRHGKKKRERLFMMMRSFAIFNHYMN
jgi:MFS family permease